MLAPVRTPFSLDPDPKAAAFSRCQGGPRADVHQPIARTRFSLVSTPPATAASQRLDARQTAPLEVLQASGAAASGEGCRVGGSRRAPPSLAGRGRQQRGGTGGRPKLARQKGSWGRESMRPWSMIRSG